MASAWTHVQHKGLDKSYVTCRAGIFDNLSSKVLRGLMISCQDASYLTLKLVYEAKEHRLPVNGATGWRRR